MDRLVKNYSQLSEKEKMVLWNGLNQGRVAFQTLVEFVNGSPNIGKSSLRFEQAADVIERYRTPFLFNEPKGENKAPDSTEKAEYDISTSVRNYSDLSRLNMPLVVTIADRNRSLIGELDLEQYDLVGFGKQGLIQSIHRFDHTGNVPFGAYAQRRIYGAMVDGVRNMSVYSRDQIKYRQVISDFENLFLFANERYPSQKEIEEGTHLDINVIKQIAAISAMSETTLRLREDQFDHDRGTSCQSLVSDYGLEDRIDVLPDVLAVRKALQGDLLTSNELKVINLLFFEEYNQSEAANFTGLSPTRVSQLFSSAKRKLALSLGQ